MGVEIKGYNPSYRIGFCGVTSEEKLKIKNALDNRFFQFYEEINLDSDLFHKPDLIISGENIISSELQGILDFSLASLIMVSSKSEEELIGTEMFSLHGNDFNQLIESITRTAMYQNALKARVYLETQCKKLGSDSVDVLLSMLNEKDSDITLMHSINVSDYSVMIAQELGYDERSVEKVKIGGLLHDIGKFCLPDSILFNTTKKLDDNQMDVMQNHASLGTILLPDEFEDVMDMVLLHHERFDGSGYPFGLGENQISDMVRIISVADSYDAMTSKRTYQEVMTDDVVFGILYKLSEDNSKLDRRIVLALENVINRVNEKQVSKVK